jgi:hypothetical protein
MLKTGMRFLFLRRRNIGRLADMPDSDKFVQVTDSLIARIEAPMREARRTRSPFVNWSCASAGCARCGGRHRAVPNQASVPGSARLHPALVVERRHDKACTSSRREFRSCGLSPNRLLGNRGASDQRSISPNTMSSEPMMSCRAVASS